PDFIPMRWKSGRWLAPTWTREWGWPLGGNGARGRSRNPGGGRERGGTGRPACGDGGRPCGGDIAAKKYGGSVLIPARGRKKTTPILWHHHPPGAAGRVL